MGIFGWFGVISTHEKLIHNMKNFTFLWVAILGFATAMHGQRITDLHTFSMMPAGLSDAEATADVENPATETKREDIKRDVKIIVKNLPLGAESK